MSNFQIIRFSRLTIAVLLTVILSGDFAVSAQTRRSSPPKTVAANQSKTAAAKCSGAWTGVVTYTRTQSKTDNKTVERVSARGQDTHAWEMKYDYKASVTVTEAPEKTGASAAKANINHSFSSIEKISAKERNSCDRGKTWREMTGDSTSKTETTANANRVEANFNVGVNADGTYTVSVALPQIAGKTTGAQTSVYSNQCTPKAGKNLTMPPTDTTVDGNSLTSDGSHRVNPADPNRISGSYTNTFQNVTETISWNLQKCGAPLRILDVQFADMKFPNWNDWQEISEQKGTIDGNLVKIKVRVLNASGETKFAEVKFKETFKGDKWDGARADGLLENGAVSVRLDAGEQREVEMIWDSSGYAWFDDARPRLLQRIKAELEENGKKTDETTKNLKVAPKPVVLVHGLWSNWRAWEAWQNILTTAHSYDWKAFPVGEKPEKGAMNTGGAFLSSDATNSISENSQQLKRYIRYAQEDRNAWHVDIVAHSLGGLISRHYIHNFMLAAEQDGRPQIAHLIQLGTPNLGSPCADVMNATFEFLGKQVEAVRQLRQDAAAEFNRVNTNRKGVKFSVLAGNPLPTMCKSVVWNDGVVSVPSAIWQIKDSALSKNVHTELTGTADFSSFVKPRLAIGPKGNHNPEAPELNQLQSNLDSNKIVAPQFVKAAFARETALQNDKDRPTFAKEIKLAPGQIAEIEIPVRANPNFGVTLMANPNVSATLLDDKAAIVGKNSAGTPESKAFFRSIYVDKPVQTAIWRLKLENKQAFEATAIIAAW